MTKNQQEAIERACGHENLLQELVDALKWMIDRCDEGKYVDGECLNAARKALARATSQDVK